MKSSHPIRQHKDNRCWEIILFSQYLYKKLEELGGITRKSLTIRFPRIPAPYLRDFVRGYFDGDGSVFRVSYRSTKDHKLRSELRSNFTSGSRIFLKELMEILFQAIGLKRKVLGSYNKGRSWKLGYGTKDTIRLLSFLYYSDCPIALKRKEEFSTITS